MLSHHLRRRLNINYRLELTEINDSNILHLQVLRLHPGDQQHMDKLMIFVTDQDYEVRK